MRKDERAVGIKDVLFGSLTIACCRHFLKLVLHRQDAILGYPISWYPATMWDAQVNSSIESGLVSSGLTARDYPAYHL